MKKESGSSSRNFWNGGAAKKTAAAESMFKTTSCLLRRTRSAGAGDLLIINEPPRLLFRKYFHSPAKRVFRTSSLGWAKAKEITNQKLAWMSLVISGVFALAITARPLHPTNPIRFFIEITNQIIALQFVHYPSSCRCLTCGVTFPQNILSAALVQRAVHGPPPQGQDVQCAVASAAASEESVTLNGSNSIHTMEQNDLIGALPQ